MRKIELFTSRFHAGLFIYRMIVFMMRSCLFSSEFQFCPAVKGSIKLQKRLFGVITLSKSVLRLNYIRVLYSCHQLYFYLIEVFCNFFVKEENPSSSTIIELK